MTTLKNPNLLKNAGFINGAFTQGSATESFAVKNPATGEEIASLPRMGPEDVQVACAHAETAFQSWKKKTGSERSRMLRRLWELIKENADDLATLTTLETGKPFAEAKNEVSYANAFTENAAEEAKRVYGETLQPSFPNRRAHTLREPVGACGLITPWNFPLAMATRKMCPALAAGCTVVIKPSEETPLTTLAICSLVEEAGFPPGVVNCLTVGREEVVDTGAAMCHSEALRKISFTGSTAVGKWLYRECASTVKKISLELGGNAPFIVFDDADLKLAAGAIVNSAFRNAGQVCISSQRILVQEGVYEKFADMVAKKVKSTFKLGNGLEAATSMGPLINQAGLSKVAAHVEDSVSKGATVLLGGKPHDELNAAGGTFYEPTVLAGVTLDMAPMTEETFGPLCPLMSFKTEEEAIRIANDTRAGLAAYFCTKDVNRVFRVSEALEFGMVGVNEGAISDPMTPFGGMKESGIGRESGNHYGIEEFLEVKLVCIGVPPK
jgi:succinate-semialdehyde dehydrogenase/glutarate-semialdehyde dehydrogenase